MSLLITPTRLKKIRLLPAIAFAFGATSVISHALAAPSSAGTVWMLKGQIKAERPDGGQRPLRLGDDVRNGEALSSTEQSEAVLKMADGAMLALRPNTRFKIENVKRPDETGASFALALLKGGLRIVSGLTGRVSPSAYKVATPVATIGIRGTDHEPYVLPSGTKVGRNPAGTYDKVNEGVTFLTTGKAGTDLEPGQVGFVRDVSGASEQDRTRALATLLRPVILRYTPEFFQAGVFDHELALAKQAADVPEGGCDAGLLARKWLGALDGAIADRDADTVLALFAPDVKVTIATEPAQPAGPERGYTIDREEFVASVLQSVKELEEFSQTRQTVQAKPAETKAACTVLMVTSEVRESGRAAGQFYQSKSVESFELKQTASGYQAVSARVQALPDR